MSNNAYVILFNQRTGTDGHARRLRCAARRPQPPTHFPTHQPRGHNARRHKSLADASQMGRAHDERIIERRGTSCGILESQRASRVVVVLHLGVAGRTPVFDDTRTGRRREATEALEPSAPFRWGAHPNRRSADPKAGAINASGLNVCGRRARRGWWVAHACMRKNKPAARTRTRRQPPWPWGVHIRSTNAYPRSTEIEMSLDIKNLRCLAI